MESGPPGGPASSSAGSSEGSEESKLPELPYHRFSNGDGILVVRTLPNGELPKPDVSQARSIFIGASAKLAIGHCPPFFASLANKCAHKNLIQEPSFEMKALQMLQNTENCCAVSWR
jgi:hypothetical protein